MYSTVQSSRMAAVLRLNECSCRKRERRLLGVVIGSRAKRLLQRIPELLHLAPRMKMPAAAQLSFENSREISIRQLCCYRKQAIQLGMNDCCLTLVGIPAKCVGCCDWGPLLDSDVLVQISA